MKIRATMTFENYEVKTIELHMNSFLSGIASDGVDVTTGESYSLQVSTLTMFRSKGNVRLAEIVKLAELNLDIQYETNENPIPEDFTKTMYTSPHKSAYLKEKPQWLYAGDRVVIWNRLSCIATPPQIMGRGVVVSSFMSDNLSCHGSDQYELLYKVRGDNGKFHVGYQDKWEGAALNYGGTECWFVKC